MKKIILFFSLATVLSLGHAQQRFVNPEKEPLDPAFHDNLLKEFEDSFYESNYVVVAELHRQIMDLLDDPRTLFRSKEYDEKAKETYNKMHDFQAKGFDTGWHYGYTYAFAKQRKELSQTAIPRFWQQGEKKEIVLDEKKLGFIEISEMLDMVCPLNGKHLEKEILIFQKALHLYFPSIIRLVGESLSWNKEEALYRYQEIEGPLSRLLYHKYIEIAYSKNSYYRPPFFSFSNYQAAEILQLLISSVVTSLIDAVYTYEQEDWKSILTTGFDLNGTVFEQLITKVLHLTEAQMLQIAIKKDYENYIGYVTENLKSTLKPIPMETRQYSYPISGNISVGSKFLASIDMQSLYIAWVGIDLENISVELNHNRQMFAVYIPDEPRLMKSIFEDYKVLNVNNTMQIDCDMKNTIVKRQEKTIPPAKLKRLYKKNKLPIQNTNILNAQLDHTKTLILLEPLIQKTFEQAIALFHSCYGVELYFGNNYINLIPSPCKEQITENQKKN